MAPSQNQAAWLRAAGTALEVGDAPMPTAGTDEIVVKNSAVAINPIDWHMQDVGIFVQSWPTIMGCDVAGVVFEVGPGVKRFKVGDRVIGHSIGFLSGRNQDASFQLYSTLSIHKAAILPDAKSFRDGVVVPFALEAGVVAFSAKEVGFAMPGVPTPALGLPLPSIEDPLSSGGKSIVIYGASASTGSMAVQIAVATGMHVVAVAGARNFDLVKRCGAAEVIDHKDPAVVEKVVKALKAAEGREFVGIFDAVSTPDAYLNDLAILEKMGGGHLACTHPPPADAPGNVKSGMILAVDDIVAPVFKDFVTPALTAGIIQCLPPPTVVGKGLQYINEALAMSKAGVSGTKLVVEL